MKMTNLLGTALLVVFLFPLSALARDVYPDRKLEDIYVLTTEGNRAQVKVKGAEKEYVTIGDVIGEEKMVVGKMDSLTLTVKSSYGDTAARLPVGGGLGF